MSLRGYDAWKTREPDEFFNRERCEQCDLPLIREKINGRVYWLCERCDDDPPEEEHPR